MDTRRPSRWHSALRLYLLAYAVTSFGSGMIYPLNAIYLSEHRGMGHGVVAAYFVVFSVASMATTPLTSLFLHKVGPTGLFGIGLAGQAAGMLMIVLIPTLWGPYLAALAGGAGAGAYYAMLTPVLVSVFGLDNLSRVFGQQYRVANLSMAASGLISGALVTGLDSAGFVIGYVCNALSFVVFGLIVLGPVRRRAGHASDPADDTEAPERPGRARTWRDAWAPYRDTSFLPLLGVQACIVVFGVAQLETVVPLVLHTSAHLPVWGITTALVVNCVTVMLLQGWGVRWVSAHSTLAALNLALVLWLGSLVFGVAATALPWTQGRVVAVMLYAAVFGCGEVLVSPSLQPLAARTAPDGGLAPYTASLSLAYSLGLVIGPAVMLQVFYRLGYGTYWTTLGCGVGVALVLLAVFRRRSAAARREWAAHAPDADGIGTAQAAS
ncbi:MFS transporter [Streptomyces sp. NPDC007851]|uniref:MFS transporter n=1 Tax=Streptomyces sp. NPDC007851 TaxID=3155008 RepID=UPI0033D29A86